MKYKNINSMLHNFAHSFCSDMNMVFEDNEFQGFIFAKINELLKKPDIPGITINFSNGEIMPPSARFAFLEKSVGTYRDWLVKHAANHQIELDRIDNVLLQFIPAAKQDGLEFRCEASCTDDRGKTYNVTKT